MNLQEISVLGKHGNVWLVFDRISNKVVVRKSLEVFNRRIYEWLKTVSNPHIPRIICCEENQGKLWVIEEYINGDTLEERLEHVHHLQEDEAFPILLGVIEALSFLHRQTPPVIHRDVKLSNIMVSNDGIVKLIDYNAARYYGLGMSKDTEMIGTAGYAAPEQFGFAQTDARTDIYAFGVVMNYLLTGAHVSLCPYQGAWGEVIRKCTQIDPEKRFQTMEEVKEALCKNRDLSWMGTEKFERLRKSNEREINTQLWPLPGFRSRKFWKIVVALMGYMGIYSIASDLKIEGSPGGIWMGIERTCVGISMLFIVAMVTDYGGISRFIPLIRHEKFLLRLAGYMIFGFTGICVMVVFFLFLEGIFVG